MPSISRRRLIQEMEDAGYRVLSLTQGRHYRLTVEREGRTATVPVSVTPKSDFWPTWVLADIKRAMRQED